MGWHRLPAFKQLVVQQRRQHHRTQTPNAITKPGVSAGALRDSKSRPAAARAVTKPSSA
jgi:hypothetical protein